MVVGGKGSTLVNGVKHLKTRVPPELHTALKLKAVEHGITLEEVQLQLLSEVHKFKFKGGRHGNTGKASQR